jgi:hypothetical protein
MIRHTLFALALAVAVGSAGAAIGATAAFVILPIVGVSA